MGIFRKKPVEIEAFQMMGSPTETINVCLWVESNGYPWLLGDATQPETLVPEGKDDGQPGDPGMYIDPASGELIIRTLEGDMRVSYADWVIKGVKGEFSPCKPDIFKATYERVVDPDYG